MRLCEKPHCLRGHTCGLFIPLYNRTGDLYNRPGGLFALLFTQGRALLYNVRSLEEQLCRTFSGRKCALQAVPKHFFHVRSGTESQI